MGYTKTKAKLKKKTLILWGMTLSISFLILATVWNQISNRYVEEIESFRENKNDHLKTSSDSPIEDQVNFKGLKYFDPDPTYKVKPTLEIFSDSTYLTIVNNDGERNQYRRYARAIFTIGKNTDTLTIFQKVKKDGEKYFFVPFIDETNGDETYAGGRYLEFPNPPNPEDFMLDFNMAYNPYCVYNYRFSCPIPPRENILSMRIEAGERMFQK